MRRSFILLLLISMAQLTLAQKNYKPGYYITMAGEKVEGLIRNDQWRYNPDEILFKSTEESDPIRLTPDVVKTVEISGELKFLGGPINIDFSPDDLDKITRYAEARPERATVFIKTVIEGKASLYEYVKDGFRRYFYSLDGSAPEQLTHKVYLKDNIVTYNKLFKTQLWDNLKCESIDLAQIQKLEYYKKELETFFIGYNQCQNAEYKEYKGGKAKSQLHVWIRPGMQGSSWDLIQDTGLRQRVYDTEGTKYNFRLGVLLEYSLPFRGGKLSLVAEPTIQSTTLTGETFVSSLTTPRTFLAIADYSAIVLPLGLKYDVIEIGKSTLALSAFVFTDIIDFNSTVMIEESREFEVNSQPGVALEVSYSFANRFSASFQYAVERDLISNTDGIADNISAQLSFFSVNFGYRVF